MKGRVLEIAILAVAAIVVGGLALRDQSIANKAQHISVFSTNDTGRNGYRALYEVLHAAGVPVRRFLHPPGLLESDVRTLVISGYEDDPHQKPMDGHDAQALRRFVESGGRLVVLDDDFAGKDDITPGVARSTTVKANGAVRVKENRFTTGVTHVAAEVTAAFPFSERSGVPLLANSAGIVAIAYRLGKGEVEAITAPQIFSNARLSEADNARFAFDAVAGHGPVAFDEYVHGYDADESFWDALPAPVKTAVWIVAAIVLLALIGANVPFAPPISLEPPDERDSSAYLDAMAALMRRAGAARAAIDVFATDVSRRARRTDSAKTAVALAELDRLATVASDDAVLRAAGVDYHLRKDIAS